MFVSFTDKMAAMLKLYLRFKFRFLRTTEFDSVTLTRIVLLILTSTRQTKRNKVLSDIDIMYRER